jgi:hypothetical protein
MSTGQDLPKDKENSDSISRSFHLRHGRTIGGKEFELASPPPFS